MRRRGLVAAGVAAVATAAAAGAAAWNRERAWQAAGDPDDADLLALPAGRSFTVTTDDGAGLAVTDAGTGPMVVLAHCYTGSRGVWAPVARRLVAGGHRVVLWDQRGHGASTVGTDGLSIERLGDDMRAVLEAVDATDAVLGGHSMGGMTVMALVGRHPDVVALRARALTLVSTAAAGMAAVPRLEGATAALMGSTLATFATAGPLGPFIVRGTEGRRPVWAHLDATARLYAATPPQTRAGLLRSITALDLRPGLGHCPVPAVVVVGTQDRLTPRRLSEEIARCLPDAEVVVLPDAGHMLPFEEPDRLSAIIGEQAAAAGGPRAATAG